MTPYSQNMMQGNPYGNSDSYYDAPSGVASIGYGAKPRRRLVAIRNGEEIYDDDFNAPFETASVTNAHNDQRQADWNQRGAQYAMQKAQGLQEDNYNPSAIAAQGLAQRYQKNKAPSYSRFGNEFSMNGKMMTTDLEGTAKAAGMSADDYIQNQYSAAKQKAAQEAMARLSGDSIVGTSQAQGLLQDPQFLGLDDNTKMSLYKQIQGRDLQSDLKADKYGGNLTANQLAAKMGVGKRREAAIQRMKGVESIYGVNPAALIQYYDPKTQTATIPGKDIFNEDKNTWEQSPPQSIAMPFAQYQNLLNDRAEMSGFEDDGQMSANDPQKEYEEMSKRRQQMMQAVPQALDATRLASDPIGEYARKLPRLADREAQRPAMEANKRLRMQNATEEAAKRMAIEAARRKEEEMLMQQIQNQQTYQPQVNYLRGF